MVQHLVTKVLTMYAVPLYSDVRLVSERMRPLCMENLLGFLEDSALHAALYDLVQYVC
jgi:hypothetical protein